MSGVKVYGMVARFGEMAWPFPCEAMDELQHRLRYGEPTRSDMLQAAAIIDAYGSLVMTNDRKRRAVVRQLREAETQSCDGGGA